MSHAAAAEMIAEIWKEAWTAGALAEMPVEIQNHEFERPENAAWARYTLLPGDTTPAALGDRLERTPFALVLQIFLPEGTGTRLAYRAADAMRRLDYRMARRVDDDGETVVYFQTAGLTPGVREKGIEPFNVTIRGHFDTSRIA